MFGLADGGDDWKKKHKRLYGEGSPEAGRQARMKKAMQLLTDLERRYALWFYPDAHNGRLRMFNPTAEKVNVPSSVVRQAAKYEDELLELTAKRAKDGVLDGRLLVFLEEVSFYDGKTETRYHFPRGAMRVVEHHLAEKLVALGGAVYHPGPE